MRISLRRTITATLSLFILWAGVAEAATTMSYADQLTVLKRITDRLEPWVSGKARIAVFNVELVPVYKIRFISANCSEGVSLGACRSDLARAGIGGDIRFDIALTEVDPASIVVKERNASENEPVLAVSFACQANMRCIINGRGIAPAHDVLVCGSRDACTQLKQNFATLVENARMAPERKDTGTSSADLAAILAPPRAGPPAAIADPGRILFPGNQNAAGQAVSSPTGQDAGNDIPGLLARLQRGAGKVQRVVRYEDDQAGGSSVYDLDQSLAYDAAKQTLTITVATTNTIRTGLSRPPTVSTKRFIVPLGQVQVRTTDVAAYKGGKAESSDFPIVSLQCTSAQNCSVARFGTQREYMINSTYIECARDACDEILRDIVSLISLVPKGGPNLMVQERPAP